MRGFIDFIREQGVVGFAVGFILGGAISALVKSFIEDIVSPVLALGTSNLSTLTEAYLQVGSAKIMWGSFLNDLINFIVLAFVVYFAVKILKLDKLDKKKDKVG
ncbi:MscL family protein [Candidatus Gottesmanbacteria bacterium]|nr:MscL family protein [Candidatus Gottesmanbacteria bacterium]